MLDENKKLLNFLARRHPLYEAMAEHWEFMRETYEGGPQWFCKHVFRYHKEGPDEYEDRVKRAYRFNHSREVVDLTVKYLFRMDANRSESAPESVSAFWERTTRDGVKIREFMRSVATENGVSGRPWIVIDSTLDAPVATKAEEKQAGAQIYAYIVDPVNMLNMSYDDGGELRWALVHELVRDDKDPVESSGEMKSQFRLWTREDSTVFRIEGKGQKKTVVKEEPRVHGLGIVPIIGADNVISNERWTSPSMIADVAYLDRAVANYLSNLDAIIQDQTFSQLAIPAEGIEPGTDLYTKLLELGTKRVFTFHGGEGSNQPFYLSPDVKQAQLILQVIAKIINEIYHSSGLAGERTKEDNSQGIDNSSGVAKAYDFERVNGLLAAKADSLELIENRMARIVRMYAGEIDVKLETLVKYPDDFDVRGLYDEFDIASRLVLIEAPDGMRRQQMESVIDKLFPMLKKDLKDALVAELKNWPPKPVVDPATGQSAGGAGSVTGKNTAKIKEAGTQSLSGQLASATN